MNDPQKKLRSDLPPWLDQIAAGLAILTALAGVLRIALVRPWSEALNDDALKYFAVAGGLLLLRKVKSISFGDTKVEMQELKQEVQTLKEDVTELGEETKTTASMAQHLSSTASAEFPAGATTPPADPSKSGPAADASSIAAKNRASWNRKPGNARNDPWKSVFGEKAERDHRRLCGEVAESKGHPGWYRVRLWVESTNPDEHPLAGRVRFFVHDGFPESKPFVKVAQGKAELRLHAYGAFTAGALADEGSTELELDLSENPDFPERFRNAD
jgi:hypothetical protein